MFPGKIQDVDHVEFMQPAQKTKSNLVPFFFVILYVDVLNFPFPDSCCCNPTKQGTVQNGDPALHVQFNNLCFLTPFSACQ